MLVITEISPVQYAPSCTKHDLKSWGVHFCTWAITMGDYSVARKDPPLRCSQEGVLRARGWLTRRNLFNGHEGNLPRSLVLRSNENIFSETGHIARTSPTTRVHSN